MHTGRILHPTYRVRSGIPVVQLYGRLDDGHAFLVEDDRFRPYFYVRTEHRDTLRDEPGIELRGTELHDLAGQPLSRLTVDIPASVRPLRDKLRGMGIACLEADVRFPYRYLMDHALRTDLVIHGEPTSDRGGLRYFHNPEIGAGESHARLSHLSLDLETTPDASAIYSAALAGCGVEEVHIVSDEAVRGAIAHANERDLLVALAERIRTLDPDLLLGWNVIDFDLQVFVRRAEALGLSTTEASIGRTPGRIDFQTDRGFTRQGRASVAGRMVVDGIPLVRDALRLDDYRLDTVARAVLGRRKLIDEEAPDAAAEITRMYREDKEALVAYNLEDARLVPLILEKEGLIDLTLERSRLTGMQLDRVGASIANFDLLYLPELRREGVVAPSVDAERRGRAGDRWRGARQRAGADAQCRGVRLQEPVPEPDPDLSTSTPSRSHADGRRRTAGPSSLPTAPASAATTRSCPTSSSASCRAARRPASAAIGTPARPSRS